MPKCLLKYQWVKLPRAHLPAGKGIMGYWAKLASRSAFRKGQAHYCSYTNDVMPGMWSGGMVPEYPLDTGVLPCQRRRGAGSPAARPRHALGSP